MENKPLPQVTCPKCNYVQSFRNQQSCIHCSANWSNWDIAVQLKVPYGAGNRAIPLKPDEFYSCEECAQPIQEMPVLDTGFFFHIACWVQKRIRSQQPVKNVPARKSA